MIDFKKLKEIINQNNSFLLTTHVNPDADAIGSEIAFYKLLKSLDKKIHIVNHSQTPYNLQFLDDEKVIEKYDKQKHSEIFNSVDVLAGLDFNRSGRMVSMKEDFVNSNKTKIIIDHHQDAEDFIDYVFVDTEYCATGHIIYDFIKQTKIIELNYSIAYPIYAAIMTDTGSFRFERTTPQVHKIAAELLETGVSPIEVFDKIYDQSKFSKVKLLGKALESLKLYGDKKEISYMFLKQDDFSLFGAIESDTDSFVNLTLSIEKVKIGLLFIELKQGFKVSFRSKGNIAVNKLAAEFGGGGHTNAAGLRIFNEKVEDFIPKILSKSEEYLEGK
jgi:bifunctional oligoribonuclease and PAP phosphatase NrnA